MSVVSSISSNKSSSNVSDLKPNSVKAVFSNSQVKGDVSKVVCDKERIIESPVKQRVFTNSNVCAKSINALLAKGNKYKVLHNMKQSALKLNNSIGQGKNNKSSHTKIFKRSVKIYNGQQSQGDMQGDTSENVDGSVSSTSSVVVNENNEHMSADSNPVAQNGANNQVNSDDILLYDINGLHEDKFAHSLFFKQTRHHALNSTVENCGYFKKWKEQRKYNFGFVPLGDFILPMSANASHQKVDNPVDLHNLVKGSGTYNFLGCRIPIKLQLHVDEWECELQDYWDVQLCEFLKFGFPLDFNRNSKLRWENKNKNSATQFLADVDAYLEEELKYQAIMGPFKQSPIQNCHFLPFMTREKANAAHRRVIIDLSWPKDASVNLGVDKNSYMATNFALTFPTVDNITDALNEAGAGAHLFKIDISHAFRHIKIDPFDFDLLGLKWCHVTYFDTCLPFRSRHRMQIFQRVSDAVRFITRRDGYDIINYVDNFVGVGIRSVASAAFEHLKNVLQRLGLEMSVKKLVPPTTKAVCLGVEIDSINKTISMPDEKLKVIQQMLHDWRHKKYCSKQQLQSLLGNLLYIHKCVRPAHIFLNRMLDLLRMNYDKKSITLTHDFKRNLMWFITFVQRYNGVSFFDHKLSHDIIKLDACLTGFGGHWANYIYHIPIEKHYGNLAITQLEMLNILAAIRVFAVYWHKKRIHIRCDNLAVVQVLRLGKARDVFLGACARNIWLEAARADIDLSYSHIAGTQNVVADLLSRWQNSVEQAQKLHKAIQNPTWMSIPHNVLQLNNHI